MRSVSSEREQAKMFPQRAYVRRILTDDNLGRVVPSSNEDQKQLA